MRALFGPAAAMTPPSLRFAALRAAAAVFVVAVLLPGGPAAAKVDLYTVQGISVDESAPSTAQAKRAAMAEARAEAFGHPPAPPYASQRP